MPVGPIVAFVLLLVLVVGFRPLSRWATVRSARQAGVELQSFSLNVGIDEIDLYGVDMTLIGVPDVTVHADHVRIPIPRFSPSSVYAEGVQVRAPLDVGTLFALSAWGARASLPINVANLSVDAWPVQLTRMEVAPTPDGGVVRRGHLRVADAPFGLLVPPVTWKRSPDALTFSLGDPAAPPLAGVELRSTPTARRVGLVLPETKLGWLAAVFGSFAPLTGDATVAGEASLEVPMESGPVIGSVTATLRTLRRDTALSQLLLPDGPLSLKATFSFGPEDPSGNPFELGVAIASLSLSGRGRLSLGATQSVHAELAGTVPCPTSIAGVRIPGLPSTTRVVLAVDAGTAGPSFNVRPTFDPGCGGSRFW